MKHILLVLISLLVVLAGRGFPAPPATSPALPSEETIRTAPVMIDDMLVLSVRGIESFSAEERALGIAERIRKIAADPAVTPGSIIAVESEHVTDIRAGAEHIAFVFDADAALAGVSRQALTKVYIGKINSAIEKYRLARTRENLARGAGYSLLATIGIIVILILLAKLQRRLQSILEVRYKARIHALQIQALEVVQAERIWTALTGAMRAVRLVLTLAVFFVYLHLVFGFFPWTRLLSANLMDYVAVPVTTILKGILEHIPNLIFVAILIFVTRYFLKFVKLLFTGIENRTLTIPGFEPDWSRPTYRIVRFLVIVFAVVVAYPYIPGSDAPAFKGISIFLGVLLSLGSSSFISNIIAGYTMIYRRAFKVGDRVNIGDVTGDVTEIRLLVTHLLTIKNEEVIIPNATILSSHVVNYSSLARGKGLILHTEVTIGYDAPWRQVHAMLLMAAGRTKGVMPEPSPFVLQKSLDDFYVRYELNVYTAEPQMMADTYSALHRNIQDCFNEYGVQIMSPHYLGDPASLKIVPKEKWFTKPVRPPENKEGL